MIHSTYSESVQLSTSQSILDFGSPVESELFAHHEGTKGTKFEILICPLEELAGRHFPMLDAQAINRSEP
jgi:hypothetical protein